MPAVSTGIINKSRRLLKFKNKILLFAFPVDWIIVDLCKFKQA
jgi:hypothetical protein